MNIYNFLTLLIYFPLISFTSLQTVQEYAANHPEFPPYSGENLLNPDYTVFHKSLERGFLRNQVESLAEKIGIKKRSMWDVQDSIKALTSEPGSKPQTIIGIRATAHSRFIIFSDLFGAFHSFSRDLVACKEKGFISNELKIADDTYFIINGNALGLSPYNLETVTLIINLLKLNPDQAFFLKGTQESQNFWKDYGLKREITQRIKSHKGIEDKVSSFFDTLPLSIFILTPDSSVIQISPTEIQSVKLTQKIEDALKASTTPQVIHLQAADSRAVKTSGKVKVIFRPEARAARYVPTTGLHQLSADKGVIAWSGLSSPTQTFTSLYNFHYDAFAVIEGAKLLQDWHITLYNRDIKTKEPFKSERFNLLWGTTASASGNSPQKPPLLLGCTLDLSKTSAALGKRIKEGLELRINKQNQIGGVNGHPLKIIFLDDNYTPRVAKQNIFDLVHTYKTTKIISPLGTPTTEAFLPLARGKEILIIFPYTGAMIFRQPDLTHVINLRTSYANEAKALVSYAFTTLQARKFAVFYQDDSYGKAPLSGAREQFKAMGITDWLEIPYLRNNPNIDEPAKKITDYNPDVILFFSTFAPSAALIRKIGINKIANTVFMGISFLTDVFRNFLRSKGLELIMARILPNPLSPSIEIIKEYHESINKLSPGSLVSIDSLEGYLNADVLISILEKLEYPFSNTAIISSFEKIKNRHHKGLLLNFNKETRELLNDVWIDTGTNEWIHYK